MTETQKRRFRKMHNVRPKANTTVVLPGNKQTNPRKVRKPALSEPFKPMVSVGGQTYVEGGPAHMAAKAAKARS